MDPPFSPQPEANWPRVYGGNAGRTQAGRILGSVSERPHSCRRPGGPRVVGFLAQGDPHHLDGIADQIGGALPVFWTFGIT